MTHKLSDKPSIVTVPFSQNVVKAGDLSSTKKDFTGVPITGGLQVRDGYALCNGATYDELVFPQLHAALGSPVVKEIPNGPYRTVLGGLSTGTPSGSEFIQITGSGVTNLTVINSKVFSESDADNNWWVEIIATLGFDASTSTAFTFILNGLVIEEPLQTIVGFVNEFTTSQAKAESVNANADTLIRVFRESTASIASCTINARFRVQKPTWADANLESYPVIACYDNVASNAIGLPDATAESKGLTTLNQVAEAGRNYIINGGFDFWQRGTSQSTSGYGSADRFIFVNNVTQHTVTRRDFAVGQTEVEGSPKHYAESVVTSVAGADSYYILEQRIENVSTLNGKKATLSFYAKADAPKNMAVEFTQYFGTGGSPSTTINEIGVTTISLTTNWQKHTVTVDIPSIFGKTLGTNNNDFLQILFWFDAGSDWDSRTNSLGQQSGTFDIAQVKLEEGSQATKFTRAGGTYAGEERLCYRYYYTPDDARPVVFSSIATAASQRLYTSVDFPVRMRANPFVVRTPQSENNCTFSSISFARETGFYFDYLSDGAGVCSVFTDYAADAEL